MRADKFFAEHFHSRTKAAEALEKGLVLRKGKALKPADRVEEGEEFTFLDDLRYVSNGGYKLERALDVFAQEVAGEIAVDVGASTGGFTDVLLQRGAKKVYCVDVGESLLDGRISSRKEVVVMDGTNARYLKKQDFPDRISLVVSDVSFISLKLILPAVEEILEEGGRAFVLVKPQFEAGKERINKNGIVSVKYHREILADFYSFCTKTSLAPKAIVNAPIREKKNIEYVTMLQKGGFPVSFDEYIRSASDFYENR